MNSESSSNNRREFIKTTGKLAAAGVLAGVAVPSVHAAEDNTIRLALIGCGSRGTGAAANALSVKNGPTKLVAAADVFEDRLSGSLKRLKRRCSESADVPEERRFCGFDAYRKAMDCLSPGDVAIFATPPAFRWVHFDYAIRKGLNVFMEKPTTVDGPTTRKMLALADESEKRNLKVGVGLMYRHCKARQELHRMIGDGKIGEILLMRAYRMHGPVASFASPRRPAEIPELHYQIRRFHSFIWASGGCFSDFNIHNIDECCWMKNAWPVEAQASGGRHYRGDSIDQNFDNYSVEYTFGDGTKLFFNGRCIDGCHEQTDSFAHGTKGLAAIFEPRIYKGQNPSNDELLWKASRTGGFYQYEWDDLIDAIRNDKPYNEARRGAESSLVSSMGRMAAHTGRVATYDQILNNDHELAPNVDSLTMDSPAPLLADNDGKYPVPMPGIQTTREY